MPRRNGYGKLLLPSNGRISRQRPRGRAIDHRQLIQFTPNMNPEQQARVNIDRLLEQAGWAVQNRDAVNLYASKGVAVREFPLKTGHGTADYLLYVDAKAAGVIEAKPEGTTLTGVEVQFEKYGEGLPDNLPAYLRPLPFLYESTGVETQFTNRLDPEPRSRLVFSFYRPETLAEWLGRFHHISLWPNTSE